MKINLTRPFSLVAGFIIYLLLWSCSDEPEPSRVALIKDDVINVVNDRLSFKTTKSFMETIDKLNRMSDTQLSEFRNRYDFNALIKVPIDSSSTADETLQILPTSYKAILNHNGEVLIGDTIVWYTASGRKHLIPRMNETELAVIRINESRSKIVSQFSVNRMQSLSEKESSNARWIWNAPGNKATESRYQREFYYRNDPGSRRKYVHELYNLIDNGNYSLYFVIKLEWYGSRSKKWQPAGEARYISYNLTCNVQLYRGRDGINGSTYKVLSNAASNWTGNYSIWITSDHLTYSNSTYWTIDMQGYVYHEIMNDPNNGWYHSGYPIY